MVRFKNRWLLVQLLPATLPSPTTQLPTYPNLNAQKIYNVVKQSIILNFGDVGWGSVTSSLNVKYFSPLTGMLILRVARDHFRIVWGAVTLLTSIEGQKVLPFVVHCSGTIKHVQQAAIKHNKILIAGLKTNEAKTGVLSTRVGNFISTNGKYEDLLERSAREIEALQD